MSHCTLKVYNQLSIKVFIRNYVSLLGLAESRLLSEEGVGRVERERRTEEPRQGRGGRGAGKEKGENVVSEKETEKRDQRRITYFSAALGAGSSTFSFSCPDIS